MKKVSIFFLALILAAFLCACGTQDVPEVPDTAQSTSVPETEEPGHIDLADFNMIRAERAEQDMISLVADVFTRLGEIDTDGKVGVFDDFLMPGTSADSSVPEILFGMTNRPESAEALSALPGYLDFSVGMVGQKLCIVANTVDRLRAAGEYFLANLAMENGSLIYTGGNYIGRYDYPLADARIAGVSPAEFTLVYPAGDAVAQRAAERMSAWFAEQTGCMLSVRDDSSAAGTHEILLGRTARDGSLDPDSLENKTFRIRAEGGRLVLAATSLSGYGAVQERLGELLAAGQLGADFDETASHGFANLDGVRVLFVGNSFTYYGRCTVNRNRIVDNDSGYFYQAARAMGDEVKVSSFTFNGSILRTDSTSRTSLYDLMLETFPNHYGKGGEMDEFYDQDVVILQQQNVDMANTQSVIRLFMELFSPETQFCVFIHHSNVQRDQRNVLGAAETLRDEGSVIYLPVGHLVYDVWTGRTAVPGATLKYNQDSFCVNQDDDRHHPNYLTGYLTALTVYYALTGQSVQDCSHAFVDRSLEYYKNGATSNYPAILSSDADMRGLKQLVEEYVDKYN